MQYLEKNPGRLLEELKKRGIKTSFVEMEKLLRKGFSHLASYTEALEI